MIMNGDTATGLLKKLYLWDDKILRTSSFVLIGMGKKRLIIRDKKLREIVKSNEKKVMKRNFLELLRRAARTIEDS